MQDSIITFIRLNRVSTAEITDAMEKTGVLSGVRPINSQMHCVGKIRWVYAYDETNWDFHEQIRAVQPNEILLVEAFNCEERAIFGSLVSKFLILYRQVAAIVVLGFVRDVHHLIKERYPIWVYGITPVGCYNRKGTLPFDESIITARREVYNDAIAVCDDSGVAIIPKEKHTRDFLDKLVHMENQEDTWFDCIDRRKWDTFDTVCLKKYLV